MSGSVAAAKRAYFKGVTGSTQNAVADLEAEYYEKSLAGTVTPVAPATATVNGTVKKGAAVADVPAQTVTDIATAQTAVNVLVAKINALLASQRAAGQLS